MLDDRFWTKVDKEHPSGCWIWTANRNNKGYGLFRPGGSAPKMLAHRVSYLDACGPIPEGGMILHSCDTPLCVNPDHLRVGTAQDNASDMDIRGRRVVSPMRGEDNPQSKLDASTVLLMRDAYLAGESAKSISRRFCFEFATVSDVLRAKSWRSVLRPEEDAALSAAARSARMSAKKITKAQADDIRVRLSKGERGVDVAKLFGISAATVSDIKRRKIWP